VGFKESKSNTKELLKDIQREIARHPYLKGVENPANYDNEPRRIINIIRLRRGLIDAANPELFFKIALLLIKTPIQDSSGDQKRLTDCRTNINLSAYRIFRLAITKQFPPSLSGKTTVPFSYCFKDLIILQKLMTMQRTDRE